MNNPNSSTSLVIAGIPINMDAEGRACLNDLHRAAVTIGSNSRTKEPGKFLASPHIVDLIHELETTQNLGSFGDTQNSGIAPLIRIEGRHGGTYGCKELVYAYAMWISASFHLKVIRAYDALVTGPVQPATVPGLFSDALHLIANQFGVIDQRLERQDKRIDTLQDLIVQVAHRRQRSGRFVNPDQISLGLYPAESPSRAAPCPHPRREHQRQLSDGRRVNVRGTFVGQRTH